jgi:hypothetical protein
MRFARHKYTLTQFTQRNYFDLAALVQINDRIIALELVVRILGVQLDFRAKLESTYRSCKQQNRDPNIRRGSTALT